jgi:hypothetical protein
LDSSGSTLEAHRSGVSTHIRLLLRYGGAVASVAVALGVKLLLDPFIGQHSFLLLAGAVMVSAWFGGLGPGLLATALATYRENPRAAHNR